MSFELHINPSLEIWQGILEWWELWGEFEEEEEDDESGRDCSRKRRDSNRTPRTSIYKEKTVYHKTRDTKNGRHIYIVRGRDSS